jgi:hypothetical protein
MSVIFKIVYQHQKPDLCLAKLRLIFAKFQPQRILCRVFMSFDVNIPIERFKLTIKQLLYILHPLCYYLHTYYNL